MDMVTQSAGASGSLAPSAWLLRFDRSFRLFGKLALALLLATVGLLAADVEAWRGVFALAHLVVLVAVLPLGVVLIAHGFREAAAAGEPGLSGVLRRHRVVATLLAVALVAITLSLANFEGGSRAIRRVANLTTVALVLVLVWRYLAWARERLPRR